MIVASDAVFPNNVVDIMATRFGGIDPDVQVFRRPLRESDPVQSIGIFAALWVPDVESMEMMGAISPGPSEPTLQKYSIAIQAFVKDMDEERGLAVHSVLSKMIVSMLYRDQPLRVALASLNASTLGWNERLKRWGVTTQRFLNNELDSEWLYLSTVECWVETETY